ncbi:MAG: DUF2158 domain-containing protein [Terracidiphilus sp.]
MEQQKFFTGQTVKLKSGGPVMTVMGTNLFGNPNMYVCQWFSGKSYKQAEFPGPNLKLAAPEMPKRVAARTKPGRIHLG